VYAATLWKSAVSGDSKLVAFFMPYTERPGRDRAWYDEQAGSMTPQGLKHFAPINAEDALAGDDVNPFVPIELWDRCHDPTLPELTIEENLVVGVDAGVSNDCFAIVGVTRAPAKPDDVALRVQKLWTPRRIGEHIDFEGPENFLKTLMRGGCVLGHPLAGPEGDDSGLRPDECDACNAGEMTPKYNVVQICYDPYQLESMMQKFRKDGESWVEPFQQGSERLIADSALRDLILGRRLTHTGDPQVRQHIENSAAKLDPDQQDRLRIVKKDQALKVDYTVALSMAAHRCLYLLL
jgi:phage terminase large subunit-like protein